MSYFENTTNLSKALGYIDQTDFKVHINPKSVAQQRRATLTGAMIGQITYDITGKDPQACNKRGTGFSDIYLV